MSKLRNILLASIALITISGFSPSYPQTRKTQRTQSKNKQAVKITAQKIENDIVGKTTDNASWRFDKNEPRKITIGESRYGNPYATIIVTIETEGFAGYLFLVPLKGYANGKLRLHYEWITNEWILLKVENLTFKIIRTEAIVPKTPPIPEKSPIEKEVKRKLEATFKKYPNPNPKEGLPKAEVTYLVLGDVFEYENNMKLFEFTDFHIDISGNATSSSDIELLNGIDWEWKGSGRTTAKAVRKWDDKLQTWGSYKKNPDFDCGITATKQRGKDYEITPLRCIPGNITAFVLSQEVINVLERKEINFDEFVDRTKIELGNINLAKAKEIANDIMSRTFRRCNNNLWYTSAGFQISTREARHDFRVIYQIEDLKPRIVENRLESDRLKEAKGWSGTIAFTVTSFRIYYPYQFGYYSTLIEKGWTEKLKGNLFREIVISKFGDEWFVGTFSKESQKWVPNSLKFRSEWIVPPDGSTFLDNPEQPDCSTVNKMLASNPVSQ